MLNVTRASILSTVRAFSLRRRRLHSRLAGQFDAIVVSRYTGDRHELFTQLRQDAPIFYSTALRAWVISRYSDVRGVLQDRTFGPVTQGPGMSVLEGGFGSWTGREHSKKMGIIARRIRTPRALKDEIGTKAAAIARELAAQLPHGEEVDLRDVYAKGVPLLVMCGLTDVNEPVRLRAWYETVTARAAASRTYDDVRAVGLEAMRELDSLLGPVLQRRRHDPGVDLISDLVSATYDEEPLPEEEILQVIAQLYSATMETTERVLTSSFRHLARDHELLDSLRERLHDDETLSSFGAEALRMYAPIQAITRAVAGPAQVAGRDMQVGETVALLLASANRDEKRFAYGHRFDANRFLDNPDRQYTAAGDIVSFGGGETHCVGSRLAKILIVESIRHVFDRVRRIELREDGNDTGNLIFWSPASLRAVLHPPG